MSFSETEKKQSFVNTSRRHYYLHPEIQEQWKELSYQAAKTLAADLKDNHKELLTFIPSDVDNGCSLFKKAADLRVEIDDKLNLGNYKVGKPRDNDPPFTIMSDGVLKNLGNINIFEVNMTKISEIFFPDQPIKETINELTKNGFNKTIQVENTSYNIHLIKTKDEGDFDQIILRQPHHLDNMELIKKSIENIKSCFEGEKETPEILKSLSAFKRNYILAEPFFGGSAAIADMVEKAVLETKDIGYGAYKHGHVSRDVMAFLCPDNDTYHKEYLNLQEKIPRRENEMVEVASIRQMESVKQLSA